MCHAVMKDIAPQIVVIDVSHGIPPFDVRAGAWVLASALPYTPVGVHLAVVDPGWARTEWRSPCDVGAAMCWSAPTTAYDSGGRAAGRNIRGPMHRERGHDATPRVLYLHGRDRLTAAAALAASASFSGGSDGRGRGARPGAAARARVRRTPCGRRGSAVDSFGNIRTNLESDRWPLTWRRCAAPHPQRYDGRTGSPHLWRGESGNAFVFEDSSGYICLAINLDSAGARLNVSAGTRLDIERL
ncbi:MAG: SAM-dependent chlorinase/fluorinase [Chloroflexia bacterium]